MAQEELEIEIAPDGKVTARTHGIKGAACMDWADLVARIVGREESREKTAEYYEAVVTQQSRRTVDVRQQRGR
jgi:ABC-type Fe3+-hydroxamate transport system substrate-binding protein